MMEEISTDRAPKPIGPYSQARRAGGWLYCSGQIPLDPERGVLVEGGIREQTEQVLDNLAAVLQAAGAGWPQVVKTTLYLADLSDFGEVNRVYAGYLRPPFPARVVIQAAALPAGARIEMEAVAYLGETI